MHDGDRAIAAIMGEKLADHALERMNSKVDGERRAGAREIRERLAFRHRGGARPEMRVSTTDWRDLRQGQLMSERRGIAAAKEGTPGVTV